MCALWLSLWLCAARCALGDTGLITENRSAKIQVSCGFDISGVLLSAGKIGTGIWKVQDSCKVQETERQRLKCASQLQQLIGITSFSAAFASASASNCARTFSAPAKCAAGSLAFVGLLEFMAAALVNLKTACIDDLQPEHLRGSKPRLLAELNASSVHRHVPLRVLPAGGQRMLDEQLMQRIRDSLDVREKREKRRVKIADCFFDAGLAALFAGRGVMSVVLAAQHSPCEDMVPNGEFGDHLEEAQVACLAEITGIVGVFSLVSVLVLGAVQVCPIEANAPPKETKCAQDILTVIGGITSLIQEGAILDLECKPDEHAAIIDADLADLEVA